MAKWLCWGSLGVAGVLLLVFLLDLVAGFPFSSSVPKGSGSPFLIVDITGILASAIVAYLAFNAMRDL